jgi:hypothetical protein
MLLVQNLAPGKVGPTVPRSAGLICSVYSVIGNFPPDRLNGFFENRDLGRILTLGRSPKPESRHFPIKVPIGLPLLRRRRS